MKKTGFYKDKVVVITGSGMGIGKEIARQVLNQGGSVVLTGRNPDRLSAAASEFREFKERVHYLAGDVSCPLFSNKLIQDSVARFGRLNLLINNAGLSCYGKTEEVTPEVMKQVIDTNIYGSLFPIRAALPELKKTNGRIMLISSIAAFHGLPGYSAYSLSKMSLTALAQSLAAELKKDGVLVCLAFVGFTENDPLKRTLSPDGSGEPVPARPKLLTSPRERTAARILNQLSRGDFASTHSLLGKATSAASRFFPGLTRALFALSHKYNSK